VDKVESDWRTSGAIRYAVAALAIHSTPTRRVDDASAEKAFDRIAASLDEAKSDLSKIVMSNNGISPKYLRKLFFPLGIDLPQAPPLVLSVETFSSIRGSVAHTRQAGGARQRSPNDVRAIVEDCRKYAEQIRDKVLQI
jgi:hypothetical protein